MAVHPRKKISINIVIPFLLFILLFSIMIWQKYRSSHEVPIASPQQQTVGTRSIILFFAAEDGSHLVREARETDACENEDECLKGVLDELLNGPVGELEEAVPEGTVIESVHVEGTLATLELNRTFSETMVSGSSAEMLAVYAIVDTVAANFPTLQKVKLNIEGNAAIVLHHLDLSEPLAPDYSLERPPVQDNSKGPAGISPIRKGTGQ